MPPRTRPHRPARAATGRPAAARRPILRCGPPAPPPRHRAGRARPPRRSSAAASSECEAQLGGAQLSQLATARSRASGSGGSARLASTSCRPGGRCSSRNRQRRVHRLRARPGGSRRGPAAASSSPGWSASSLTSAVTSASNDADARRAQQRADPLGDPRAAPGPARPPHAPEPRRVVVASVQRQPRHRPPAIASPVGQHGRLTEPGRGANQHQLSRQPLAERLDQARARHKSRLRAGTCNLVASSTSCPGKATLAWAATGWSAIGDLPLSAASDPRSGRRLRPF